MLQYQSHSRSSEARDFALLVDNNSYVQNWSIIQISVILLTCSIQVSNWKYKIREVTEDVCVCNRSKSCFHISVSGVFCAQTFRYKYWRLWTSTNLMKDHVTVTTSYLLMNSHNWCFMWTFYLPIKIVFVLGCIVAYESDYSINFLFDVRHFHL